MEEEFSTSIECRSSVVSELKKKYCLILTNKAGLLARAAKPSETRVVHPSQ